MSTITLREIDGTNVVAICKLEVSPGQERYVAPAAQTIAECHYEPTAWMRAIYADDEPVGLVALTFDTDAPEYALGRLLIAADHQGKGYGRQVMELVIDHVRTLPNATELLTSYVPGEDGPAGFYARLGFEETGEVHEGERVVSLRL